LISLQEFADMISFLSLILL